MLGPSRKRRSRRSSTSNAPSCRTTSAPRDHGPSDRVPHRQRRGGVGRAPDGVAAPDVEPVLGLDPCREDGAVRVRDVLACPADSRRRGDEREITGRRVVRRRVGNVLRIPLRTLLVEMDVGRESHLHDRRLERASTDDQGGVGRRDDALERRGSDRRHARHHDGADLHRPEDDLEPVDRRPGDDEHAIAGADARLTQRRRPDGRAVRDLEEVPVLDDPFPAERRQRTALGVARERLDDVAREVEAVRDLPATVHEGGPEGELERRHGNVAVAPTAPSDTQTFHGLSIIDRIRDS